MVPHILYIITTALKEKKIKLLGLAGYQPCQKNESFKFSKISYIKGISNDRREHLIPSSSLHTHVYTTHTYIYTYITCTHICMFKPHTSIHTEKKKEWITNIIHSSKKRTHDNSIQPYSQITSKREDNYLQIKRNFNGLLCRWHYLIYRNAIKII